jgi:SLBB domain
MCYPKFCYFIEIIIIIAVITLPLYAQKDTRVTSEELKKTGMNYFNYSDPGKINIEINVLGGVRYPGRYLVPEGTTVIELLSLSGNVLQEETADNIKLIRSTHQSGELSDSNIITLSYREIFKDEKLKSINKPNPVLVHGDILVVPITPGKTFWDIFRDVSLVVTPLATVATLIISIISLSKQ